MILYVPGGGGTASSTPSPLISSTVWTVAKCRSDSSHPIIAVARKHYITAAKVRLCCWNLSFSHRPFLASPIPFPLSLSFLFGSPSGFAFNSFFLSYLRCSSTSSPTLSFIYFHLTHLWPVYLDCTSFVILTAFVSNMACIFFPTPRGLSAPFSR